MKLSALASFSDGLRNYLDFDTYGEQRFIEKAREKYEAALLADSSADLARLHLGAALYVSTEPATLTKAIEHFSLLLGNQHCGLLPMTRDFLPLFCATSTAKADALPYTGISLRCLK
jgi:hypothetical protein